VLGCAFSVVASSSWNSLPLQV